MNSRGPPAGLQLSMSVYSTSAACCKRGCWFGEAGFRGDAQDQATKGCHSTGRSSKTLQPVVQGFGVGFRVWALRRCGKRLKRLLSGRVVRTLLGFDRPTFPKACPSLTRFRPPIRVNSKEAGKQGSGHFSGFDSHTVGFPVYPRLFRLANFSKEKRRPLKLLPQLAGETQACRTREAMLGSIVHQNP